MKVIKIERSFENCSEAGWIGYDIFFDKKIDDNFVNKLVSFGCLMYLSSLKIPFFKLDNKNYMIKGNLNQNNIRIGIRDNNIELLEELIVKLTI